MAVRNPHLRHAVVALTAMIALVGPPVEGRGLLQKAQGRCVCVFDFDQTLRVERGSNKDTPAPDGPAIIQTCYDRKYGVAIASANSNWGKLQSVLSKYGVPDVFSPSFFSSDAFQVGRREKDIELEAIKQYYDTWPTCMMFFDDSGYNRQYADKLGVIWQQVDGARGVSWDDFKSAESRLLSACSCS